MDTSESSNNQKRHDPHLQLQLTPPGEVLRRKTEDREKRKREKESQNIQEKLKKSQAASTRPKPCIIKTINELDPSDSYGHFQTQNPLLCRVMEEHYTILNKIDEGTFGQVFRAQENKTGRIIAIKELKFLKPQVIAEGFPLSSLREIGHLLSLKHPNIIDIIEIVQNKQKCFCIVMEYVEHELRSLMENKDLFSLGEIKNILAQLLSATEYLSDHQIMHRDMKTANILFTSNGSLKVCDFGLARTCSTDLKELYTAPHVVTLWYRAPEILLSNKYFHYTDKIDMWSVGVIFLEMLLLKNPFCGKGELEQLHVIAQYLGRPSKEDWPEFDSLCESLSISVDALFSQNSYPQWNKLIPLNTLLPSGVLLSNSGFDLLRRMLCWNPRDRISAKDALQHPFFKQDPLPKPVVLRNFEDTNSKERQKKKPHVE